MNKSQNFFHWLKKETLRSPSKSVDLKILNLAKEKESSPFQWKILTASMAACLILILTLKTNQGPSVMSFNESPEMLKYYDQIELMSETSSISDEDWNKIMSEAK